MEEERKRREVREWQETWKNEREGREKQKSQIGRKCNYMHQLLYHFLKIISYSNTTVYYGIHERSECIPVDSY